MGFPGGSDGKASACSAGDLGSILGLGRSPGEGNGNPLQCSCLENPRDEGAWLAAIYGVAQSQTWLKQLSSSSSRSFPMSWLFASGSQSIGALVSASVLPMNIQGWFPCGLTSLISLLSRGLSRVFSSTTFQKHQFFTSINESCWCLIIYCFKL